MKKMFVSIALLLMCLGLSMAQHGTAEPGFYPPGYNGDTWTGEVTAVNEETREFTLTYKKGDKEQTFVAVLPKGYTAKMKDGSEQEVRMAAMMGLRVKVYYVKKTKKVNDQKVKENEVFNIKFLQSSK